MTINVGDILIPQYRIPLIAASYLISVLGSYAALYHAQYMYKKDGSLNKSMLAGAATALGGVGIWAMHFVGMIGYSLPMRVVYDGVLTLLSLVAAIVIAGCALALAGGRGRFSKTGWIAGSLLAGVGVCVMHYMGMYAMNLQAAMELDTDRVLISVAIAVTASAAALWLAHHVATTFHRVAAALTMGVAVCAMHYTGMSAATFICIQKSTPPIWAIGGVHLPELTFLVTGFVLVFLYWNVSGYLTKVDPTERRANTRRPSSAART